VDLYGFVDLFGLISYSIAHCVKEIL